MTTTTKFNLGEVVRDRITGLEGTIINYFFHLNGCQHIEVERQPIDGAPQESLSGNEDRFEAVKLTELYKLPDISNCHVKLGDMVKDTLTGFTGHAILITSPLFGAARIGIEPPKLNKDGTLPEAMFFDEQRVVVTQRKTVPVAPDMPEERKASTGCNPTKVSARHLGRTL